MHRDFSDVDQAFAHVCQVFGSPRFADDWRATWQSEHAMVRRRGDHRDHSELPEDIKNLVHGVVQKIGNRS